MSVSVSMPQLGESVTEGTVTRWLKKEGERVEADEPLLEVSTDKVDTEIPSPVSGILRGITVAEDETVAVGAELAVIDEEGSAPGAAPADSTAGAGSAAAPGSSAAQDNGQSAAPAAPPAQGAPPYQPQAQGAPPYQPQAQAAPPYQPPSGQAPAAAEPVSQPLSYERPAVADVPQQAAPPQAPAQQAPAPPQGAPPAQAGADEGQPADGDSPLASGTDGPYVTPLVRKLATEHGVDLGSVAGTGVGGRIRKQDVIDAARVLREPGAPAAAGQAPAAPAAPQPAAAAPAAAPAAGQAPAAPAREPEADRAGPRSSRPACAARLSTCRGPAR